jgi:hypothetical protein
MAVATLDFYLRPEDGWTLVATNPATLLIKPDAFHPWWVAVTAAGAPVATILGVPMGKNSNDRLETFESSAITGEVYIRIMAPPVSSPASKMHFGVVRDQ